MALMMCWELSQPHHHCHTAPVFEGDVWHSSWDRTTSSGFDVHAYFAQDAKNTRMATYDHVYAQQEERLHFIRLWGVAEGDVEYRIDLMNNNACTSKLMTRPFRAKGIPENATWHGQQYIGASGYRDGSILTNFFTADFGNTKTDHWEGLYSRGDVGCWPVTEHYHYVASNGDVEVGHTNYYNLAEGNHNTSIFDVPANCPKPSQDYPKTALF
jgi:hypothetical protein